MNNYSKLAEGKLIIIYLLYKMNLPVSISYIQEFALDSECMDYFSLASHLADLSENKYIVKNIENNKTTYTIAEKGYKVLDLFENLVPPYIKQSIDDYVQNNKLQLKKELDIIATYEQIYDNEFEVRCSAHENGLSIMQLNFKVANKKYAKIMCDNWKKNAPHYYISFIRALLEGKKEDK